MFKSNVYVYGKIHIYMCTERSVKHLIANAGFVLWGDEGLLVETRTLTGALIQLYVSTSHAFMVCSQIVIAT